MLNQTIIVGRLVRDCEIKETENGAKYTNITLAVQRTFKNMNGEYDTDFLNVRIYGEIAENTAKYCRRGDLIGVKGRLQTFTKGKKSVMEVVGEKITFLASKKVGNEVEKQQQEDKTEEVEIDKNI